MLLTNKVIVVYGAGGAVGSAVARAFAKEGARVFATGAPSRAGRTDRDGLFSAEGFHERPAVHAAASTRAPDRCVDERVQRHVYEDGDSVIT